MDGIIFVLLLIGIPISFSIWIYRLIKKKGLNPTCRIIAFIPIIIAGHFIYNAFYPSEEFYEEDFKEVTGVELPESSYFEFKTASYPDTHGDYTSVSIINVDEEFYIKLPLNLIKNGLSENEANIGHIEKDKAISRLNDRKIETEFSREDEGKFYYVAFLSDKKTILVQRSSH